MQRLFYHRQSVFFRAFFCAIWKMVEKILFGKTKKCARETISNKQNAKWRTKTEENYKLNLWGKTHFTRLNTEKMLSTNLVTKCKTEFGEILYDKVKCTQIWLFNRICGHIFLVVKLILSNLNAFQILKIMLMLLFFEWRVGNNSKIYFVFPSCKIICCDD